MSDDVDVHELAPGIAVVRCPLPVRTAPANAYVLSADDGSAVIVDAGTAHTATARWTQALARLGLAPAAVTSIVVTHHHPDHIGGSGALHDLTGARVLATRSTIAQAPDVWGAGPQRQSYFADLAAHFRAHGLPPDILERLSAEEAAVGSLIDLPPATAWSAIGDGDEILVGGDTWTVRETPGHADGHLVLANYDRDALVAGDHLLEHISPAVGQFPRHDRDPLGRYLESLLRTLALPTACVYPGHGDPFANGQARARVLHAHHRDRLDACVAAVATRDAGTAFDIAQHVFTRVFANDPIDAASARFATTETLAHLVRAERECFVRSRRDADGLMRWSAAAG